MKDIELITQSVKRQFPTIQVNQYYKTHPADDDGVCWFSLPNIEPDIKLDSPDRNCPFMVETNELWGENARTANDINEVTSLIVDYLKSV